MDKEWSSDVVLAGSTSDWCKRLPKAETNWPAGVIAAWKTLSGGSSLSLEQGLELYAEPDLASVGELAAMVKISRFGTHVFFNSNVHVNQTNICVLACKFCAFRRGRKAKDAYAMDIETYLSEVGKFADHVDEVHSVGGLHPDWGIEHYEELFKSATTTFPHIHFKALTAVEIQHISRLSNISIETCLKRLKKAGLSSLPGGGAEILDDEVREVICRGKESSDEYLEIHRVAHRIGIPSNCTMLFATIESREQRLAHMISLRELQRETSGFQCFVPYPFLPDDSRLPNAQLATGVETLRTIAISRLMLDNIPHIKAYRMNLGDSLSELALSYGADDLDGTVHQESIMHLAGSVTPLDIDRNILGKIIENTGSIAVQRNTIYTRFSLFESKEIPPLRGLKMAS
jgi:aminodeoxyfutalosine synthase